MKRNRLSKCDSAGSHPRTSIPKYLGEFLYIQKRVDEAKAVWKEIAAGALRNDVNLSRLAEIYNSFGFSDEACENRAESINSHPKISPLF